MAETYFRTKFKGYDPEQVDAFIISLSDTYDRNQKEAAEELRAAKAESERLCEELAELQKSFEEAVKSHEERLREKQEEYDLLYAQIGEKMVVADNRASEIINGAEKEAQLILEQAKRESVVAAENIRKEAEAQAASMIDATRRKCDDISAAAEEFRLKQEEMNRSMYETEKRFGDALSKLREGIGESNDN